MQDFASYATTFTGFDFTNVWAPPAQAGQAAQTVGYYPQLYATTPIVVLTGTATKVYGAPLSSIVAGQNGGLGLYAFGPAGDTLPAPAVIAPGVGAGSNVNTYVIIFNAGNSTNSALGVAYRIINGSGAGILSITPAALTITYAANPLSRFYGAANPALTGTESAAGLVNGDTLAGVTAGSASYATTATNGSNIGSYAINGSGLSANSGNYSFTFAQAAGNATALTINPAALTITYTANPFSRTYGAANPALSGAQSATGLVNGDTLAGVTSGSASYATTATSTSNVGGYAVTGSGLSANSGNYSFTFAQAAGNATALTINPALLTGVITVDNKTYDGTTAATGTIGLSGMVNGDQIGTIGSVFTFADKNAGTGKTVTVTGTTLNGTGAGNYTLALPASASADILKKALAGTATVNSKTYDGTTTATGTVGLTGIVSGDTVRTAGTAFTFVDKNAGTAKTVTVAGTILKGTDAGNYTLTIPSTAVADILKKALTSTVAVDTKTYDGTTAATGSASLSGVIVGDYVVAKNLVLAFADKNAGTGKTVSVSGGRLAGTDAGNYTLVLPATALGDILKKALGATITVNTKTYDGTTAATGSIALSGVIAGDAVVGKNLVLSFLDPNPGTGKTVSVGSARLAGIDAGNYTLTLPATVLGDILSQF